MTRPVPAALAAFLLAVAPLSAAVAAEAPPPGGAVTLAQCLELAAGNHPALARARGGVAASSARLRQSESSRLPSIDGSASYSRSSAPGEEELPGVGTLSAGVSLSYLIYDFGRRENRIESSRSSFSSSELSLADARVQVAYGVRSAYFGHLSARRSAEVAAGTVAQAERRLAQAKGFFEAGTRPRYDVTKAEVDLADARVGLIVARNRIQTTRNLLREAVGGTLPEGEVEDNLDAAPVTVELPAMLARATSLRPDLRAAEASLASARASYQVARRDFKPTVNGSASYSLSGEDSLEDDSWRAGVTLSVPLYTGGALDAAAAESEAAVSQSLADLAALRNQVNREVTAAVLALGEAAERIPAALLAVKRAEENLALAEGRYSAGVGSQIEVADAQTALTTERDAHIQALYDHQLALAALKQAVGEE